jgi:hypothetical protein
VVLLAVFDDGELEVESDLGRGQADAGGEAKGREHLGDGLMELRSVDLIGAERARELPEYGVTGLYDFERQWAVLGEVLF